VAPDQKTRRVEGFIEALAKAALMSVCPTRRSQRTRASRARREEGLGPAAIARRLGIGRASVYRVLGKDITAGNADGGANADQA
jgi:DNA invertase Pin-like site-specific DNA recombinase